MKIQDVLKLPEGTKVIGINDNVFTVADNGVGYKCLKSEIGTLIEYIYPFHLIVDYDYRVLREKFSFKQLVELQKESEKEIHICVDRVPVLNRIAPYSIVSYREFLRILSKCTSKVSANIISNCETFELVPEDEVAESR